MTNDIINKELVNKIESLLKKAKNEEFNFLDINRYNDSVNNMNSYSIQCNCRCKGSYRGYRV